MMLGGIVWGTVATGAAPLLGAPAQILNEAAKNDTVSMSASYSSLPAVLRTAPAPSDEKM